MKIKGEYILREVAGETVAVPVGETVLKSNILVTLNESGQFLWKLLAGNGKSEQEIIEAFVDEYEVDEETVRTDLKEFVEYLSQNKVEVEE